MKAISFLRSIAIVAVLIGLNTFMFAQAELGRISGSVTDVNGAVVAGATVKVTNQATGETRTAVLSDDGTFIITNLKPTRYSLNVTANGFQTVDQRDIEVLAAQEKALTIKLPAQGVTAQVDVVSGEDTLVNVSSASLSANVNPREVEGLPINGRQLSQLYLQAPGAQNTGAGTFADIRFSGRANQQNVVRYDGVEGTAIIDASPGNLNGEVATPFRLQSSLENVQEFRVESSNFPAEFGTGTGGQVNVVTKSGGNQFHGSVFEYLRRDALDAANFFDNATPGATKSKLTLDQYGGSIGGPIIKDKLFFFGSFEKYRGRFGKNFVEAAPSLTLAQPGALIPGTSTPVNPLVQPFIAAFRSPNAVVIPGVSAANGFDILQLQDVEKVDEKAYAARFDYQWTPKQRLYFRYFRDEGTDISPEGISGRVTTISAVPQNAVAGLQSIFGKGGNVINEFKVGLNAARTRINGSAPTVGGLDFSAITLNISGSVANTGIAGQGTSTGISIPGGLVRANSATNGRGQPYTPYSLGFIDSLSWTKGNHNLKFGGEIRLIRLYTDRLGGTTYTFQNLASFLSNSPQQVQYLGDVSSPSPFTDGPGGTRLAKQEYYIGYAQDEWKIRPGLTLNYGLRYEYYSPLVEANDQQILFSIEKGVLRPPTEAPYKTSKTNFGPRVAVTWSPDQNGTGFFSGGRTVLRGGFGIYYGPGQTEDQIQPIESDRISSTISSSTLFNGTQLLAFPAPIDAIIANFNANPNNRSYQPRAYSANYKVPERVYQYTASWQQDWGKGYTSTIAYVGSKGRNLFLRSVANKILPGSTTILNGTNIPNGFGVVNRTDPETGRVIGVNTIREFSILSGTSVQNPYAEVDYKTSGGRDSYNALQMTFQRSFSQGLTMNAQYTFAKSEGTSAGSNEARTSAQLDNFEADFGRNNFDVRHNFNISALYALPIGKGKHWDLGGAGNAFLGNWEVGGIINARSGVPIEVLIVRPDVVIQCTNPAAGCTAGQVVSLPGTVNAANPLPAGFTAMINTPGGGASRNNRRPDLIAGVNPFLDSDRNFLNPAAFATPAPGTYGNMARNALSGPSFWQADLILNKRFRVTETMNFEFRTEFFNVFNHTNFTNPSSTLNNALSSSFQPGQPFTQSLAGPTFGVLRSTVNQTVGLGTPRQIQFGFRFNF
jgi:hypothetical protein